MQRAIPKSDTVNVNPEVIKWLRESSGLEIKDVNEKLRASVPPIEKFEVGEISPTLHHLKALSKLFKYPLSSFYLPEPPIEKPLPKDFRFLSNKNQNKFTQKTRFAIRDARDIQRLCQELSLNIKDSISPDVEHLNPSFKPEKAAQKYRDMFDLDWDEQEKFPTTSKRFNHLRELLEERNILVLQFSMPVKDARGFVLTDDEPMVIVINSKDNINARLFTLMHEFGHVLLRNTVINMPGQKTTHRIENWCNEFASSFLLPEEHARELFKENKAELLKIETLNKLSKKYKVSVKTLLMRMEKLDYITSSECKKVIDKYEPSESNKAIQRSFDRICRSRVGNRFISIVARNFDEKFITSADTLEYLSIKTKHLEKVLMRTQNEW